MTRIIALSVLAVILAACTPTNDGRSQLEVSAGIPPEYAGQLNSTELATIHSIQNDSTLNSQQQQSRIDKILSGKSIQYNTGI